MDWRADQLSERDIYKLLVNTVLPRPIVLVTTCDANGGFNAAPFSFFNVMDSEPPIVAFGIEASPDKPDGLKDTERNIAQSGEFVVNLVDEALVDAMNVCAMDFSSDIDEISVAGLTMATSQQVRAPRIAESPVQLECRQHTTLLIGPKRHLVIGEVVHLHIRDDIVDERLHIDPDRLGLVGRLHGNGWYCRIADRFQAPRPSLENWLRMTKDKSP